jgi:hypothetical protein
VAELRDVIEERYYRRGDINLKLIINHSHRNLRFMDYRVGKYLEKREALETLAKDLKLRKIYTLVEKQDSNNWRSVGFVREGVYPSFFRTADAYVMSRLFDESGEPIPPSGPLKPQADEQTSFPGRKLHKPEGLRILPVQDEQTRTKLVSGLNGELRALPFCRASAPDLVLHAKAKRKEGWVCAEIDDSFGYATLAFAPVPKGEADLTLSAYAGNSLLTELHDRRINNLFGLSPSSDRWSNELFAGLGFKVTGRLAKHLQTSDGRTTALIWHRRLTSPQGGKGAAQERRN